MTQNLKIEVLTGDISIEGMVVTNLVTKEELSTAIVKKADLGTDGKIPTNQLPAEIVNTAGIVDEVKLQLESSIKDAVDESNAYAESYTDNAVSSKADLVAGKVPLEQLPAIDQYPQFGTALSNLSTSILTSVKQRTDQLEKTKADLGEDGKVLREQIPSYEKISGLPEQLEVMSTQTAAVSGELEQHKLQTADQIDTLKENIEANVQKLTDRQSHLMRTYATKELGVDAKVGVKPGEYFYVRSTNEEEMLIEYQNVAGVPTPSGKSYPSTAAVQQVAKHTALPLVDGKAYGQNERVQLANGDIVKSAVDGNTKNPNADMTGWVNEYAFKKYYLSSFGAIPNNPGFAAYNEAILVNALKLGAVIVDGEYYVSCSKSWEMTGSIRLLGFGESSKINFTRTTNRWLMLPSIDELLLDGVNINASNPTLTNSLFAGINDTIYIKSFSLKNSIINFPNGRIFSQRFSKTTNPYTTDLGIKKTFIAGNTFNGTATVINAINMPFDIFIAVDNNLNNSDSCTFYLGNDNDHTYGSQLKGKQKLALFHRNTVVNDDDHFSTIAQTYYCLALVECNACFYQGNHVEGLKTRVNDVVVYDIYANSNFLLSKNNTWKNNLAMTPTKMYADLMKSKGTVASVYKNNTYILEEDFVVRHDATGAGIPWVQAFVKSSISQNSKFIMLDNTIDVYQLLGMSSSNLTKHVDIRRNTIKAKYFAGTFLFIRNTHEEVSTYSDTDVIFKDNELDFEYTGGVTRNGTLYNTTSIVGMNHTPDSEQGDYRSIVVKDNNYTVGQAVLTTSLVSTLIADTVDVTGNEITIRGGIENYRMWSLLRGKNVKNENKVIDLSSGLISFNAINARYQIVGTLEFGFDFNGKYNRRLGFEIAKPTKPVFLKLKNTLTSASGSYSYSYTLKLDANGLTYVDNETGVETTTAYPADSSFVTFTPKQYVTDVLDTALLTTAGANNEYIRINTGFTAAIAENAETIQSLKVTAIS